MAYLTATESLELSIKKVSDLVLAQGIRWSKELIADNCTEREKVSDEMKKDLKKYLRVAIREASERFATQHYRRSL